MTFIVLFLVELWPIIRHEYKFMMIGK